MTRLFDQFLARLGYHRRPPLVEVVVDAGPPPSRAQVLQMIDLGFGSGEPVSMVVDTTGPLNETLTIKLTFRIPRSAA